MTTFSANPTDLSDAIAYELDAIEYLRCTLYDQGETVTGGTTLTLGDLTPDGDLRRNTRHVMHTSISEGDVRAALDRFRPLTFSAAFKIQDMIVEWILRPNGVRAWTFSEKLKKYDRLFATGTLNEPSFFSGQPIMSRAFWELYRFLRPFRGTVIHSGGVLLGGDGTISITKDAQTVRFTPSEQASYMRSMCLISKILSEQTIQNPFLVHLIEGDLRKLEKYHGQPGLIVRRSLVEALTVHVPSTHVAMETPLAIPIDFDLLRRTMEKTYPVGPDGRLYFSVSVIAQVGTRKFVWELPIESVPTGLTTIQEGDAEFDRFLKISTDSSCS